MTERSDPCLVSVIIPCYNTERWIQSAVESCLEQTYPRLEVIVVDDGSTDHSRRLLTRYDNRINVIASDHVGSSAARNRGLSVARGEYIQFLDADDYILPDKITRQVQFLEETNADAVYGDWRHRYHARTGESWLGPISVAGVQADIVGSVFDDWFVPCMALLHRRTMVDMVGGWDERFNELDDKAFFLAEVLVGADIRYQPGCFSVYRNYNALTQSQRNPPKILDNIVTILTETERTLSTRSELTPVRRQKLAHAYFRLARTYYRFDRTRRKELLAMAERTCPSCRPSVSRVFDLVARLAGLEVAEQLAAVKQGWRRGQK